MVRYLNGPEREASWGALEKESVAVVGALDGSNVSIRLLDRISCMGQDGIVSVVCMCTEQPRLGCTNRRRRVARVVPMAYIVIG